MVTVTRGDVVLCDLNPVIGAEQAGARPAVVLQIDRANAVSPHTIIAALPENQSGPRQSPLS
uniref:Type II toxin-antitoxin system PemK/MazF family toxin n=1 Tax=Desulfatirhabdium butyrativorans TaxID=340467 RepID=A0A7C4RUC9_9BACT